MGFKDPGLSIYINKTPRDLVLNVLKKYDGGVDTFDQDTDQWQTLCEQNNEPSGSIKDGEVLNPLKPKLV
jgi:hypothetical protein